MKTEMRITKDYKVVPESIWNFFFQKYGGTEIKRIYRKGYGYGAEIEATLKEIPICVFPAIEDLGSLTKIEPKSIFMSKYDTMKNFKERFGKCLQKAGIKCSNFRLWKLKFSLENDELLKLKDEVSLKLEESNQT